MMFFAYEDGDDGITPSIWNIDSGRVPSEDNEYFKNFPIERITPTIANSEAASGQYKGMVSISKSSSLGRYPSQLFVDENVAEDLDNQSGILKSGELKRTYKEKKSLNAYGDFKGVLEANYESSTGGSSKILHKIKYLEDDVDLAIYCPKVSTKERNAGLNDEMYIAEGIPKEIEEKIKKFLNIG